MNITRKAAIIVRGDKVLCASHFVPFEKISTRNRIRIYESVSKAESAIKHGYFNGAKATEVIESIEIPGGTSW